MTIEQAKQTIQSSTLPADIKAQALENLRLYPSGNNGLIVNPILQAINMFVWGLTPQGAPHWIKIFNRAERGEFDPPAESESVEEIEKKLVDEYANSEKWHDDFVMNKLATLIHANRLLEKRIELLENKKP